MYSTTACMRLSYSAWLRREAATVGSGYRVVREMGPPSASTIDDASLGQIVGSHFHGDLVTGEDTNVVLTHLSGDVRGHDVTGLQLHAESSVRQSLDDFTFHLNRIFFRHPLPVAPEKAANSARKAHPGSKFQGDGNRGMSAPAVIRETSALNSWRGIGLLPSERK